MNDSGIAENHQPKKLNLGCGPVVVNSWINVDYSLGARLFKLPLIPLLNTKLKLFNLQWERGIYIHNLEKTFPWGNNSVNVIYSSHTLEHFSQESGLHFITECHRVLKSGGVCRLVVPDLSFLINEYVEGRLRSDRFVRELGALPTNNRGFIGKVLSPFVSFPHKCMYDASTLISIMEDVGFEASQCGPFKSRIEDIREIELEGRTGEDAIIIEGIKH